MRNLLLRNQALPLIDTGFSWTLIFLNYCLITHVIEKIKAFIIFFFDSSCLRAILLKNGDRFHILFKCIGLFALAVRFGDIFRDHGLHLKILSQIQLCHLGDSVTCLFVKNYCLKVLEMSTWNITRLDSRALNSTGSQSFRIKLKTENYT